MRNLVKINRIAEHIAESLKRSFPACVVEVMSERDFSVKNADSGVFVYVRKDLFVDTHIWITTDQKATKIDIQTPCVAYERTLSGESYTTEIKWHEDIKSMIELIGVIDIATTDIKALLDL